MLLVLFVNNIKHLQYIDKTSLNSSQIKVKKGISSLDNGKHILILSPFYSQKYCILNLIFLMQGISGMFRRGKEVVLASRCKHGLITEQCGICQKFTGRSYPEKISTNIEKSTATKTKKAVQKYDPLNDRVNLREA